MATKAMSISDIQAALDAMPAIMCKKALREPEAEFEFRSNQSTRGMLSWAKSDRAYDRGMEFFRGANPTDILAAMNAHIDALPEPEETRRNEFLSSLAATIELGRANGIDDGYIGPLALAMKRLSENVLTDGRSDNQNDDKAAAA